MKNQKRAKTEWFNFYDCGGSKPYLDTKNWIINLLIDPSHPKSKNYSFRFDFLFDCYPISLFSATPLSTSFERNDVCRDVRCDFDATCEPDAEGYPRCVCLFGCGEASPGSFRICYPLALEVRRNRGIFRFLLDTSKSPDAF